MKRFIVILTVAFLALSVVSCLPAQLKPDSSAGSASVTAKNSEKKITVLFAHAGSESDWRVGVTNSVRATFEAEGWELLARDMNCQVENQIIQLREAITLGVDYIAFTPAIDTGWDQVMSEVREAGIPVIMVDRNIVMPNAEGYYATRICSNFIAEGEKAAQWLLDYMEHKGISGQPMNIVELQGTVGSSPAIDRKTGFENVIKAHPNLQITQSQTADFETELGKEVMESFIVKALADGTPIDVLYAHNDGMAIGAIKAIKEAGLVPGEDILIIGVDAVKLAFEAIVADEMNVTVECSPLLGPQLVEAIKDLEAGKTLPKVTYSNEYIYDDTLTHINPSLYLNAKEHLPSRVY